MLSLSFTVVKMYTSQHSVSTCIIINPGGKLYIYTAEILHPHCLPKCVYSLHEDAMIIIKLYKTTGVYTNVSMPGMIYSMLKCLTREIL